MQEVTRKVGTKVDPSFISIDTIQASTPRLTQSFFGSYWIVKDFRQTDFHGLQEELIGRIGLKKIIGLFN